MSAPLPPSMQAPVGSAGQRNDAIVIPNVSRYYHARKQWIIDQRKGSVQTYAIASKNAGGIPPSDKANNHARLLNVERLLSLLEHDFDISPAYKDEARVDQLLELIFDKHNRGFFFPEDLKKRAKALYDQFEQCNWGEAPADEVDSDDASEEDEDDEAATSPAALVPLGGTENGQVAYIRLPPANHPIWGVNGIMHGVAPKFGAKMTTAQLDRRYLGEKRSAQAYGDNGLALGDWFPTQLVALFRGAHGSRMAGISGNMRDGAYSVVVSGMYKDVDEDRLDTIYYSGPGSQDHTDPHELPKGSTQVLQASLLSRRPVRVLRSSRCALPLSPSVGIRYDGLYIVTRRLESQKNAKGGLFARYVLERIPGQESLQDIFRRSPTPQQMFDFRKIKQYF